MQNLSFFVNIPFTWNQLPSYLLCLLCPVTFRDHLSSHLCSNIEHLFCFCNPFCFLFFFSAYVYLLCGAHLPSVHTCYTYINSKINSDSNSDCPPTSRSTYGGDEKQWIVLEWSKYTDTHTTPATSELVAAIAWPVQIHSAMPPIQANLSTYHDSSLLIVWGHWDLIAYSSPTYTHAIINNYDWLVHVKKKHI